MKNTTKVRDSNKNHTGTSPSAWVKYFSHLVPKGPVLDIAAGSGRHSKLFSKLGHEVTAIDKDISQLKPLLCKGKIEALSIDLEGKLPIFSKGGPLHNQLFSGIIVVNYLHRPLTKKLLSALTPNGVLIYDTFAVGNEAFARPRNPKYLLKSNELINLCLKKLQIVAFEHGTLKSNSSFRVKQRIVAINNPDFSLKSNIGPSPHFINFPGIDN